MEYDSKTIAVLDQIEQLLKDNELTGIIILQKPGGGALRAFFTAPHSCLKTEENSLVFAHANATKEVRATTAEMIDTYAYLLTHFANGFTDLQQQVSAVYNVKPMTDPDIKFIPRKKI